MQKLLGILMVMLVGITSAAVGWEVKVGNEFRHIALDAPSGLNNPPLVIFMHGAQGNADATARDVKWDVIAEREKIVVAYPQSNGSFWDLGGTYDYDFIMAIIDTLSKTFSINHNRIYLTGWSMGGMLSYYLTCKSPEKFAAIGPSSGYPIYGESGCSNARAVPIYHIHGVYDDFVKYSDLHAFLNTRVSRYGCPSRADSSYSNNVLKEHWGPCREGSEINMVSAYKPHYYGWEESEEMWNFFKMYSLTGANNSSSSTSSSSSSAVSSSSVVTVGAQFYQFSNYGGLSAKLPIGDYTLSQLQAVGIPDNAVSSMRIDPGLTVELFDNDNFQASLGIFGSSVPDFSTENLSGKVTSIRISEGTVISMGQRLDGASMRVSMRGNLLTLTFDKPVRGKLEILAVNGQVYKKIPEREYSVGPHSFKLDRDSYGILIVTLSSEKGTFQKMLL